ncbi:FadR/GntR family transcriptional regulator [Actinomarinicola tropica]|uniref:FCD domain-containing protein n=1 Tax=Actinomarinicola tropica TaxID=2789776 RepID=A0A5Q2RI63_9ACTN|nr:FCD domain-containing protein [Actinomarinicola tropica]QGG93687.1 FCD domain-containing protein [Actinomarinicola tropica]
MTTSSASDPAPNLFGASRPEGAKLASIVAGRMVADIAAAGWPEGQVIGSEAELLERYGVSRAVFREAVRLLEHQRIGRMRRGPGGGLVVTEPSVDTVIDAVAVYLLHIQADLAEVFEARHALEQAAAELAAERLTEDDLAEMRDLADREAQGEQTSHRELHNLVAAATQNPALEFFVDLLNRVTLLYSPEASALTRAVRAESAVAHQKIVDSIVHADMHRAGRRMRTHLEAEAEFIQRRLPARPRLDEVFAAPAPGTAKLAESVARQIVGEVTDGGWVVGRPLGSEQELMERYDISRAVLREAVRVLEHHDIARMRRGPGGGLFVTEPGVDATAEAMALYLNRRNVGSAHLFEVRGIVEMTVLDRVVDGLTDEVVATLERVLDAEEAASPEEFPLVGHDLHQVLADMSGNRVLALLTNVLVRLSRTYAATMGEATGNPLPTDEITKAHRRIVEPIVARDLGLARRRMRRHLDALTGWER